MQAKGTGYRGAALLGGALALSLAAAPVAAGTLQFFANGEDLATEGFVEDKLSKDGWVLRFEHIFVALSEVTAYQTDPPFDPMPGTPMSVATSLTLPGTFVLDLVQDAGEDDRILVGEADAQPGHYNAVGWRMVPAPDGPSEGVVMLFVGTATRGDDEVQFRLASDEVHGYACGEFVGDERKGFVTGDQLADVEMTFHLDHIFGRADKAVDDPMNVGAFGFDPFASERGMQTVSLRGLHIGHAGEGHCRVVWE